MTAVHLWQIECRSNNENRFIFKERSLASKRNMNIFRDGNPDNYMVKMVERVHFYYLLISKGFLKTINKLQLGSSGSDYIELLREIIHHPVLPVFGKLVLSPNRLSKQHFRNTLESWVNHGICSIFQVFGVEIVEYHMDSNWQIGSDLK